MAINTIIQLTQGGIAASADSVVNVDVPEDGAIEAVVATISDSTLLATEGVTAELSFLSSNQLATNDARGIIYSIVLFAGGTTGRNKSSEITSVSFPGGIPVAAGERIHMHVNVVGAPSARCTFIMYMSTKGGGRRSRARR